MLYLKKYLTEGLIQMAILLSLCGVRVDMGLEPYLAPPWHDMILGPTSLLTQTQFHNLRNRMEDGQALHPKSVDLDGFFTTRRLLGLVRSLDRLQVPHSEVETWLVQRDTDPLPLGCTDLSLERAAAGGEREPTALPVESRAVVLHEEEEEDNEEGTHHVPIHHSGAVEEEEEDDDDDDDDDDEGHLRRTEGRGIPGGLYSHANREPTQNEADQTSSSIQECLRLLEETFPLTEEQQLHDVEGRREDLAHQSPGREPLLSQINHHGNPLLEMELDWQDLLAIMEPENTEVDMTGTLQGVGCEDLNQNYNNHGRRDTEADQEVLLMDTPRQHSLLRSPALLALTPSAELDDHSSAVNTRGTLTSSNVNPSQGLPNHTHLLAKDPSEDFGMGLNTEDGTTTFNMNLLTQGLDDTIGGGPCPSSESRPSFDATFHSRDLPLSRLSPSSEGNGMTEDLLTSPSSVFLVDEEENIANEDGLLSPLSDFLEDAAILDEMRLLDLALEDGFSPEMATRLEEEGFLDSRMAEQETVGKDEDSNSVTPATEDQGQSTIHLKDEEEEEGSDSGLSLDFSHSPASQCASEASSYSSSSTSSSSCVSAVESPFSEEEDEEGEEDSVGSEMEMEVTIKQEDLEEEEMGAVGGGYPEDFKNPFLPTFGDHKLYNGFFLENIGHDHTYNQPLSSDSSPSLGKMPTKHTKSSSRHDNAKPYHRSSSRRITESRMWSRDERRARVGKLPFSNELIVNLPVEEFNDLMANYQLSEEQLILVREIRRRGKNKIAAQNCRKRRLDVLLELKDNVSGLRRYRSRLLREKQEAMRNLQEMKRQLSTLYQDVFSTLRDNEGMPLDSMEHLLQFESNGSVTIASRQQGAALPRTKPSKKQRDKKK
ncbi:endoplasmic reticulum membrane sensor NFE2L1-like [Pseudochaenichthys georgianus]|uniref:endoplasmic reticulum membrane sensor NFE2L1-like n=1 Tax=Pseudochaenichthys georgianus TaxID=52239 RepID=UPI00146B560D|nr:endoplasmic reticulum membrane sensor NFE2L1-like [Pseudochaenichthys georgianus]